VTLEETVSLPLDASDEEVAQAVELGWRIYKAQREALDAQVQAMRDAQGAPPPIVVRDPDAPASEKQRHYISALQEDLAWSPEQLAGYAGEQNMDLVSMTKGQASIFIDGLKKLAEERPRYGDGARSSGQNGSGAPPPADTAEREAAPATERQVRALHKLAQDRGADIDAECRQRYGIAVAELSSEQAAALLAEWQRGSRASGPRRAASEPAL
jgi:hypothetical protein